LLAKVRKTTHERYRNALAPPTKLSAGNQGTCRLDLIVPEVSGKQFRVRERNACQPENRAQKRQFFTFDASRPLPVLVSAPLINRFTDNSYNAREDKMRRFLRYSTSQAPTLDLKRRRQFR
jgi:hypothetical protein